MKKKYSGKKVSKAGEILVNSDEEKYEWAMDVISYWRSCHEEPLEQALSTVQKIATEIDNRAFFSKRLKRTPSIIRKLKRPENKNSSLRTMQDIGGCRIVASSNKKLEIIVKKLSKLELFKNYDGTLRIRDYISKPKDDGYRSIHLIGTFHDSSGKPKKIEVQIRTKIQHDWATTLEIIELFTGEALKSNGGGNYWKTFFKGISDQLAIMEDIHIFTQLKFADQQARYLEILQSNPNVLEHAHHVDKYARTLKVSEKLHGFRETLSYSQKQLENIENGYALLVVNTEEHSLKYKYFSPEETFLAEEAYTSLEKENRKNTAITIALVHARMVRDIKMAYPNYFADSEQFLGYLVLITMASQLYKPSIISRIAEPFRRTLV